MKIGIIGSGMVGGAVANALTRTGRRVDIVLTDKDPAIAQAQALDINSGHLEHQAVRAGSLDDLRGAQVVVFAAGKRAQNGWGSKELLATNAPILDQVLPRVLELSPNAVVVIASHPMDLMTNHAAKLLGRDRATQVIGSGTMLETNLLRQTLAHEIGVHPRSVHGYVLGEESGSALVAWSSVRVAGAGLDDFLAARGEAMHFQDKSKIADRVRHAVSIAASTKGAFLFGIGAAVAHLVTAIVDDTREVLTVSAWDDASGCALSLPRVVGRGGVLQTLEPPLDADERARLEVIQGYFRNAERSRV